MDEKYQYVLSYNMYNKEREYELQRDALLHEKIIFGITVFSLLLVCCWSLASCDRRELEQAQQPKLKFFLFPTLHALGFLCLISGVFFVVVGYCLA